VLPIGTATSSEESGLEESVAMEGSVVLVLDQDAAMLEAAASALIEEDGAEESEDSESPVLVTELESEEEEVLGLTTSTSRGLAGVGCTAPVEDRVEVSSRPSVVVEVCSVFVTDCEASESPICVAEGVPVTSIIAAILVTVVVTVFVSVELRVLVAVTVLVMVKVLEESSWPTSELESADESALVLAIKKRDTPCGEEASREERPVPSLVPATPEALARSELVDDESSPSSESSESSLSPVLDAQLSSSVG
jgi:hypothetical protein